MIRRTLVSALVLSLVLGSPLARAGDTVAAESLFRDGRALMDKGDYATACPKLQESFVQDPATGTLLALALCQEQLGQTASAWANFAQVVSRAKKDGRTDREQAARQHVDALEPKLSRLTIALDASTAALPGLVVTRDGVAEGRAGWAGAPLDPGPHRVDVTAPGKLAFTATVQLGPVADSQSVNVPALIDEPSAVVPSSSAATGADRGASSTWSPLRVAGVAAFGAGLVTLGASGFFALHASSLNKESNSAQHCDASNGCDDAGLAKRNSAVNAAGVATITLVAGGVLTAAGVTLFFVGGPKKTAGSSSASLEAVPVVSPAGSALFLRGKF